MTAFSAFLHHLAAFALFSVVVSQHLIVKRVMSGENVRLLRKLSSIFWIAFVILLVVGLGRVFLWEKGWAYYKVNWPFHLKFTLYLLVGVAGVIPSLSVKSWNSAIGSSEQFEIEKGPYIKVMMSLRTQLLMLVAIILCGVFMAQGIGLFKVPQ